MLLQWFLFGYVIYILLSRIFTHFSSVVRRFKLIPTIKIPITHPKFLAMLAVYMDFHYLFARLSLIQDLE